MSEPLGFSGRVARAFQSNALTPILALAGLLLGVAIAVITPREEEPQIEVTFANIFVPFPGASVADVENLVAFPLEQKLSEIEGVKHVYSISRPGVAAVTVEFIVGEPRRDAIVRLYNQIYSNQDWVPPGLGVGQPLIRPMGIDDVPVMSLTLWTDDPQRGATELAEVAHTLEAEVKRVPGTRGVSTIGAPERAALIELDATRLAAYGLTTTDISGALAAANQVAQAGARVSGNQDIPLTAGTHLGDAAQVGELVIGLSKGQPVYLSDVATIKSGGDLPTQYVWHSSKQAGPATGTAPAVTIAIAKKPGSNAADITSAVSRRIDALRGTLIPDGIEVEITRDYGQTATDKAQKLIQKLVFATLSVVLLVLFALGRREAIVVGSAVVLTLALTLAASYFLGFTINRVSLFALIFSIGILVDDAIVIVENIHRHMELGGKSLAEAIPPAVDEVGGPTILATFTVIAALLPMAFVSGLMGPYMRPIPINASVGMLISLAVALIVTPWLSLKLLKHHADEAVAPVGAGLPRDAVAPASAPVGAGLPRDALAPASAPVGAGLPRDAVAGAVVGAGLPRDAFESQTDAEARGVNPLPQKAKSRLHRLFERVVRPFIEGAQAARRRLLLFAAMLLLVMGSAGLAVVELVVLKMLPFDNKSEFQVVLDMPEGSTLESTNAVLSELAAQVSQLPEVASVQGYAGTSAPVNFNGLVRQYYLREGANVGDLQVNLVDKHQRSRKSHDIARAARPSLAAIGARFGASVKVVEVPPGPPVMSPLVAEIYGPDPERGRALALDLARTFGKSPGIVDIDTTVEADTARDVIVVDRQRAARAGISQQQIVDALATALGGRDATFLHDGAAKYAVPVRLRLPSGDQAELAQLLALRVRAASGALVPISELVDVRPAKWEASVYHKDLMPVSFVFADEAGALDSPLYGMFSMVGDISKTGIDGTEVSQHFFRPPEEASAFALKWDGEWQITFETFRDMGLAYSVGLILIYLLVVGQFKSYVVPLIIMAPIPLTVIGVMPGHALLGAQFTATSMIGMIALAGIIVRNSILLVDFINQARAEGQALADAVVEACAVRAKPIVLTGVAAMSGGFFILDDPIFNGLAVSLIFGIFV
ncbi:MAG TPA: efflux RND transporter permease subunit, partial [Xanthomonadales bacterium]|nr:efflux RND transporter permease subunit [Xanthomonadales bacterium]